MKQSVVPILWVVLVAGAALAVAAQNPAAKAQSHVAAAKAAAKEDYPGVNTTALKTRKPADRHPFVIGNDGVKRFLTVVSECAEAQFTWLSSSAK
jgi:hypothetical protein